MQTTEASSLRADSRQAFASCSAKGFHRYPSVPFPDGNRAAFRRYEDGNVRTAEAGEHLFMGMAVGIVLPAGDQSGLRGCGIQKFLCGGGV